MFVVFFLFRVCVKKSSQERLALKILIDRPKARNEVRGNAVSVLINACCLLSVSIWFVCLPALLSVSINSCFSFLINLSPVTPLSVCKGVFVCNIVFLRRTLYLAASPCHQQPSVLIKQLIQQFSSETYGQNKQHRLASYELSLLNCENCHWQAKPHRLLPPNNIFFRRFYHLFKQGCSLDTCYVWRQRFCLYAQ